MFGRERPNLNIGFGNYFTQTAFIIAYDVRTGDDTYLLKETSRAEHVYMNIQPQQKF